MNPSSPFLSKAHSYTPPTFCAHSLSTVKKIALCYIGVLSLYSTPESTKSSRLLSTSVISGFWALAQCLAVCKLWGGQEKGNRLHIWSLNPSGWSEINLRTPETKDQWIWPCLSVLVDYQRWSGFSNSSCKEMGFESFPMGIKVPNPFI